MKFVYRNYLLVILIVVAAVSIFDRFVFALALESIKTDLGLSDTQIGLMTGIAFSAFYAVAGVPIARWADCGNRVTISALAVGAVGVMVSLCGAVNNFFQMLLVRAGIAVGESGSVPPAQSLLADYFNRAERPFAMGMYFMSYPLSMIVGYLVGGWLIDSYGWRVTFLVLGVPGLFLAVLVKFTLREPRLAQTSTAIVEVPPLLVVAKSLWMQKTYRVLFAAFCVSYFFNMGVSQWLATFFIRSHDMSTTEAGIGLALSYGVFGLVGNYLGGFFASHYAAHKEKFQMRILSILVLINVIVGLCLYFATNKYVALCFVAISAVILSFGNGPLTAAMQSLVNDRIRSVSMALTFMFGNLIGLGLGPLALGFTSDILNPNFGQDSLRYALALSCLGGFVSAYLYWKAGDSVEDDISYHVVLGKTRVSEELRREI